MSEKGSMNQDEKKETDSGSGRYRVKNILGNELMSSEERGFFDKYSSAIEEQEEIIAEQHGMETGYESKEVDRDDGLDELLRNLESMKEEYVVRRVLLGCNMGSQESIKLKYKGEDLESIPLNVEENSRIQIKEMRNETINGFTPANVEDCIGGIKQKDVKDLNIFSFGNCSMIKDGSRLEQLLSEADLQEKEEEIVSAIKEGKGLCHCFMKLNETWENLPLVGEYMTGEFPLCAGIEKVLWTDSYMMFNGKEGINMMSMLFCQYGGGIITAKESGQHIEIQKLLNSINSISYSNGASWASSEIETAKCVTLKMLEAGYSMEIIAGFVGNLVNEGKFGEFESSYYKSKPGNKPDYLKHMDKFHNYSALASGNSVCVIGTNVLVQLRKEGNCTDNEHAFGFGTAQWSFERGEELIQRYLDRFGENAYPTQSECIEIEMDYMLEELSTTYSGVIEKCESETREMDNEEKVRKIAEIVKKNYEQPRFDDLEERKEAAVIWYNILTGSENDG